MWALGIFLTLIIAAVGGIIIWQVTKDSQKLIAPTGGEGSEEQREREMNANEDSEEYRSRIRPTIQPSGETSEATTTSSSNTEADTKQKKPPTATKPQSQSSWGPISGTKNVVVNSVKGTINTGKWAMSGIWNGCGNAKNGLCNKVGN